MLQVKYYKDLNHNYIILKSDIYNENKKYQHKMISENRISHLLPCHIRNINNETYFYYEISSKQSLHNLYEKEKLGYAQLYHLLEQIHEVTKQIKEYLLEDIHILLSPEYIYVNLEKQEYYFIYFPYEITNNNLLLSFAEFLLDKTDHEDEKTLEIIYKIYELIHDEKFILADVLKLFVEPVSETIDIQTREEPPEEIKLSYTEPECSLDEWDLEDEDGEKSQQKTKIIVSTTLLFLCLIAMVGIFCIRYFCILSIEEQVITIAGIIMLIITASLLLLYLITFPVRVRKVFKGKESNKREEPNPILMNHYGMEDFQYKESDIEKEGVKGNIYGNTIFVEASLINRENKLYGLNKGNKYHIDLNKLPCTVGKMAGSVDVVIKEDTVSRIHARFTKEGEIISVTDLNSTNGTFKNGLRLEPNETIVIEPGDELRFGKMTFCYR